MRKLTMQEIEKFASRKGVRKIAVENFLMSLDPFLTESQQLYNLSVDIRLYKWNSATARAIRDGIGLAYEQKPITEQMRLF